MKPGPNKLLIIAKFLPQHPTLHLIEKEGLLKNLSILLKSWCIPYDIVNLNCEILNSYYFVDYKLSPKYGAIIWIAGIDKDYPFEFIEPLNRAVKQFNIPLIIMGNTVWHHILQELCGLEIMGQTKCKEPIQIKKKNPIIKQITETPPVYNTLPLIKISNCQVLVAQGGNPLLTLRIINNTQVYWIFTDMYHFLEEEFERDWLKNLLLQCKGYLVYKNWTNYVLMRMDDPGSIQCAWDKNWHYPTLTREQINLHLITPLKKHKAILTIFTVPGIINSENKQIEPGWNNQFTDYYGNFQDFPSTKLGLDDGIEQGVFEIQSHGLTHMLPDLLSFPGTWFNNIKTQTESVGWYREFYDELRKKDIPAMIQLNRMKLSKEWLKEQFGKETCAFIPGGWAMSKSQENNTRIIASEAGFGWCDGYLDKNLVISGWKFEGSREVPEFIGIPPNSHDFGVVKDPGQLNKYLANNVNKELIGYSDYVSCLHKEVMCESGEHMIKLYIKETKNHEINNMKMNEWEIVISQSICKKDIFHYKESGIKKTGTPNEIYIFHYDENNPELVINY
jgi:hypothetical protein